MAQPSAVKQVRPRPYAKAPLEWHPSWLRVRESKKNLAFRLHVMAIGQGFDPPGIEVDDSPDWPTTICFFLAVHPRDRRKYCGLLRELRDEGRIVFEDGRLHVLACEPPRLSTSDPRPVSVLSTSDPRPVDVSSSAVTVENHSTPETLSLKEIYIERDPARAHEAFIEEDGRTYTPYRLGNDFAVDVGLDPSPLDRGLLEFIGRKPEAERVVVRRLVLSDRPKVKQLGGLRHVVRCWETFASGVLPGASSRPGMAKADRPTMSPTAVSSLESEHAALLGRIRAARAAGDEGELYSLQNKEADVLLRLTRARSLVA